MARRPPPGPVVVALPVDDDERQAAMLLMTVEAIGPATFYRLLAAHRSARVVLELAKRHHQQNLSAELLKAIARRAIATEEQRASRLMPTLASIASASPFVGLFGTVMGILGAFNEIAEKGNASLSTVAAPIGNALFATAAGLFAAIPAVVAYNAFVSRIRIFDVEMANFSSDFLNIVKRHFFK